MQIMIQVFFENKINTEQSLCLQWFLWALHPVEFRPKNYLLFFFFLILYGFQTTSIGSINRQKKDN